MKKALIIALGALAAISICSSVHADNKKRLSFAISNMQENDLKALALAIANAGYKRAITVLSPHLSDTGRTKLQETITALQPVLDRYRANTRFQAAQNIALSNFNDIVSKYQELRTALKAKNGSMTENEIDQKLLRQELAALNTAYQSVISQMQKEKESSFFKKTADKMKKKTQATPAWPETIQTLNFETLIGNWSEFLMQARSLQSK